MNLRQSLGVLMTGAACIAVPAYAQSAPEAADSNEIVVTALKRENQKIQDVPSSIAVLGQEQLETRGVAEFSDFARSVAGLNFIDSGAGDKRYILRGINAAGEAQTAVYYDNIPMTGIGGAATDFGGRQPDLQLYDVKQIEVLRGPQGTLYGSNSQSGVIRFVTNKADPGELAGSAQGELSTTKDGGENLAIRAMVNVPIVNDVLAVRVVGYTEDYSGFVDNIYRDEKDFNDTRREGIRASVALTPDDRTTITGQYFYQNLKTGGRAYTRPYDIWIPTSDTENGNFFPAAGERAVSQIGREERRDEVNIYALTAERDIEWATVTASGSYLDRSVIDNTDNGPSFRYFEYLQRIGEFPEVDIPAGSISYAPQQSEMWSGELRLATKLPGSVNGVIGVFYSDRDNSFMTSTTVVDPVTGRSDFTQDFISQRKFDDKTKDLAVFGEATVDITDRLSVTGGARWFQTKRSLVSETIVPFFGLGAPGTTSAKAKNTDAIFKGVVSYKVTPDALVYAQYAEGYRSGGTNASSYSGVPAQYDPDSTVNYEIGAKTSWLNRALTLNVAAYLIDLNNLQVEQRFGPGGAFSGVGNIEGSAARSKGVEVDLTARPFYGTTLVFAGNYTDAKLTRDIGELGNDALKGTRLTRVPKVNFSVSADQEFPVSDTADGSVGFSVSHTGRIENSYYDSDFNLPTKAYTLVDVRGQLRFEHFRLDLYANNLFDKAAQLTVFNTINDPYVVLANRPRTIGARFSFDF